MQSEQIVAESYFDGSSYHNKGPYTISLVDGIIDSVISGEQLSDNFNITRAGFVMPGMVEAHCHLFLDGGELDFAKRSSYLKSSRENMLSVGRQSMAKSFNAGVTLIRDAGDLHGINHSLRFEQQNNLLPQPIVRSPGTAIRKTKRYGSFMAEEVDGNVTLLALMAEKITNVDDLKVLMTGIIDFEACQVKGAPQFSLNEARCITEVAKANGRKTFAHCSGYKGIDIALKADFDSIEHGFFITPEQLQIMAEKKITWVPTFSPVHFQWLRPELAGWNTQTIENLRTILDAHAVALDYAYQIGVPVLVGSDAGSYGVVHGCSYIDEIILMANTGVSLEKILHSATSLPRQIWDCKSADISPGSKAELSLFEKSPFSDLQALRQIKAIYKNGWYQPETEINLN